MREIKLLWNWLKGYKLIYLYSITTIGIATFLSFIWPMIFRVTIDSIIGKKPVEISGWLSELTIKILAFSFARESISGKLLVIAIILLLLTFLRGYFQFLKGRLSAIASEKFAENLRNKLYLQLQNLSQKFHNNAKVGDLIQRCTSDVETIRRFLGTQLNEIGRAIFMIVFALSFMLPMSTKMTLISMSLIPIIILFAYIFFKKVQYAFKKADEAEGELSAILQENITGIKVVKAFAKQEFVMEKYDKANSKHKDLTYKVIKLLAIYWSVSDFICIMQIAFVLIAGTYLTIQGKITLGMLMAFSSYVGMLLWPVRQMGRILTDMGKAFVSIQRIDEILKRPNEYSDETGEQPEINGDIVFDKVSFGYGKKQVLKNISFEIKEGETLAILGHTGAGKTTLVNFIVRLFDYDSGSIKLNGTELKKINKKYLRNKVGIILQNPFIFAGTIAENIGIAKKEYTQNEIIEVAKIANLHNDIMKFKEKYETFIGERGITLSGGQKQRIAIARMLLNDYKILIFDDSLSAVDTETDAQIRQALSHAKKNITKIIISHRLSTIAQADKIIVLKHGILIQQGTHNELIRKEGLYKKIWHIQNEIANNVKQKK